MQIEEAMVILDEILNEKCLNDVQEIVFRQSWEGYTYSEIAESSGYDANYIKDVGYKLWQLLSKALGKEITKSNFRSIIRQQTRNSFKEESEQNQTGIEPTTQEKMKTISTKNQVSITLLKTLSTLASFGTISDENRQEITNTSICLERTEEFAKLKQNIIHEDCQVLAVLTVGGNEHFLLAKLPQIEETELG